MEDIERRRRSLRVGTVVLTHRPNRSGNDAEDGPAGTPPAAEAASATTGPSPAAVVPSASAHITNPVSAPQPVEFTPRPEATLPGAGTVPAQAAPARASSAPSAGSYDDPTRIAESFDPTGWERIHEGSFLEAALVTQLSGEFTGPVLAQISVPFYSADRQRVLVPRGTRAIGTAQAVGSADQTRLAVGFHRLIFPDGRWIELTFDGLDQAGDAALKDKVNRHYLSMFAAVGAIGVLSGLTLRGSQPYLGGMAGFRAGAGQAMGQSGMQILSRFLNRYPTITIRAGHRLRIWFTSDVLVPRPPP